MDDNIHSAFVKPIFFDITTRSHLPFTDPIRRPRSLTPTKGDNSVCGATSFHIWRKILVTSSSAPPPSPPPPPPPPPSSSQPSDYQPSDDDRADRSERPTELSLSQQLLLKQYEEQVDRMTEQQCKQLSMEVIRQMIVKDNLVKSMLKGDIVRVDPPDPDKIDDDDDDDTIDLNI